MKNQRPGRGVFLSVFFIAACAGTDRGTGWQGVIRDSAGIRIVENPEQGLWAPGEAWTVTQEWVIGHGSVEPDHEFGAISGLAASTSGTVAVFDRMTSDVRIFDRTGALLDRFGRLGAGPGEFGASGPYRVLIDAGDTLYVPDPVNRRIHRFLPGGELLEALPYTWTGGGGAFGWVVLAPRTLLFHDYLSPAGESLRITFGDGSEPETVLVLQPRRPPSRERAVDPFPVRPVWAVLADGRIAVGNTSAHRVTLYAADGAVERIITAPFARAPLNPTDHERVIAMLHEMFILNGGDARTAERFQQRTAIDMPDSLPVLTAFAAGPAGTLLVQRAAALEDMDPRVWGGLNPEYGGGTRWDVFDRDGRFLGSIALPKGIRFVTVSGDIIHAVVSGAMDEDGIVRLRIDRGR